MIKTLKRWIYALTYGFGPHEIIKALKELRGGLNNVFTCGSLQKGTVHIRGL